VFDAWRVSLPNSCVISRNSAGLTGGGWYVTQASTLALTSSATIGNTAGADGGGGACRHTRVWPCAAGQFKNTFADTHFCHFACRLVRGGHRDALAGVHHQQHRRRTRRVCRMIRACTFWRYVTDCAWCDLFATGGGTMVTAGCTLNADTSDVAGNAAAAGGACRRALLPSYLARGLTGPLASTGGIVVVTGGVASFNASFIRGNTATTGGGAHVRCAACWLCIHASALFCRCTTLA
jgi:hypothetical protein